MHLPTSSKLTLQWKIDPLMIFLMNMGYSIVMLVYRSVILGGYPLKIGIHEGVVSEFRSLRQCLCWGSLGNKCVGLLVRTCKWLITMVSKSPK